jgi:hypothetical protein
MRYIIRAVPERAAFIRYLRERLPQAEWCFDRIHSGRDTFLRALHLAGRDAVVHMEEDVILTRDFTDKVEAVIANRPDHVINFFSRRKDDLTKGSRWDRAYMANCCFYLPRGYSAQLIDYAPIWIDSHPEHKCGTDLMVQGFLQSRREPYWINVPSLVQHRSATSLVRPGRSTKRQSATFTDPAP